MLSASLENWGCNDDAAASSTAAMWKPMVDNVSSSV